jgi:hypothetical protein
MSPFFAHVVGIELNEHVVVEGFGSEFAKRKMTKGEQFFIQTNHFAGKNDTEEHNPPDE